jgi:hypothetical protein
LEKKWTPSTRVSVEIAVQTVDAGNNAQSSPTPNKARCGGREKYLAMSPNSVVTFRDVCDVTDVLKGEAWRRAFPVQGPQFLPRD